MKHDANDRFEYFVFIRENKNGYINKEDIENIDYQNLLREDQERQMQFHRENLELEFPWFTEAWVFTPQY